MKPFPVTVVGASLGGLAAVEALLAALPEGLRTAIVLVQHRRHDAQSRLVELLARHSLSPVIEVDDKDPIQQGRVYVAPTGYHLLVEDGFFSLSMDEPVWFARPSIDVLFESAADAYGAQAIGVVLTGSNGDGAAGAAAIKAAGGYVLVQDPEAAESPIAPRAALAATTVDGVFDIPGLARRLVELSTSLAISPGHRRRSKPA